MSGAFALEVATTFAFVLLFGGLVLVIVRLLRGPTLADRILALDTLTMLGLALIATFALRTGFSLYIDLGIGLALVAFLSTVAFARYLMRRGDGEGGK